MTHVVAIAVIPALLLIFYIYSLDKIEKEPTRLLVRLFFLGGLSTISAMILETIGENVLKVEGVALPADVYLAIDNFLIVALAEEGGKHFVMKHMTWKNSAFNFRFDAVVYGATTSLGFAAFENILYIMNYGDSLAPTRAVTAIPLHCIAGVFMGHYYGQAKYLKDCGYEKKSGFYMAMSMIIPVLIHGFYDFLASSGTELCNIVFLVYIVVLDLVAFRKVRRYSKEDTAV
ncbi:MAG: PrsW family glutamic-type intramembrane protease [Butyrivibrio sp.]|jgi:RsiW-degrading membrane proteinase PrsW (M82 family)|nr:PrsW family glutamic-type intramembrane protease [Butyrivibrio sp.]